MLESHIFISHTSADDPFVAELRRKLEALGLAVWADSRRLTGGVVLEPSIKQAIETASHFLVVLSPNTINSGWVTKEVKYALRVQKKRTDGFKVVPLMLPGIAPSALEHWFGTEPVGIRIEIGPGGIEAAMPALLAALGEQLPVDPAPPQAKPAVSMADLILELTDPEIVQEEGKRRAAAVATLTYIPADPNAREVQSKRYKIMSPLGPIEAGEIDWYLERYCNWPIGIFKQRADRVEAQLPQWGRLLYDCLLTETARPAFEAWNGLDKSVARRFTIYVDASLVEGSPEEKQADADEAATLLLALPWELLHDGEGYLFQGRSPVRVRRQLPNRKAQEALLTRPPIRVLLVSPRPEDEKAAYIDHRVSARPLVESLSKLGDLAELTLLSPPTFPALEAELQRAAQTGKPYQVVHFDGHGVYDPHHGLGALCFEDPADVEKIQQRRSQLIDADKLAGVVRDHRIPLFFLEACQSAKSDTSPTASVAGRLLQGGVASVAAMSHSVLVETARRFVLAFYETLMGGETVGRAMLAGRQALYGDTSRGRVFTGELRLQDWFVPLLYQEDLDPQLVGGVPAAQVRTAIAQERALSLSDLPPEPEHTFVGRSRELLAAERLLEREPYVVIRGEGGEGKTTLAAELARWLVMTQRFERVAFVPLDNINDMRGVLYALGAQLVPNLLSEAGQDAKRAEQLVARALADAPTLLVLDNMESVLPPPAGSPAVSTFEPDILQAILALCGRLVKIGSTRLIFTSREAMPDPFGQNHIALGRLDRWAAIALVGHVLGEGKLMPAAQDAGQSEEEIERLVEAVGCHARGLVLLAREVSRSGVRVTTERLHELMAALHQRYPDDRERSLFASVELSLRRLPAETRAKIRPLGVFQGGGFIQAIARVLGLDMEKDEQNVVAQQLIDAGLAEGMNYGYLRFDPALAPFLLAEMSEAEREEARTAWAEVMRQLAAFLSLQIHKNPNLAFGLAQWELPNLLAALEHLAHTGEATDVVELATDIERLAQPLGRAKAVARAAAVREAAEKRLGEGWSHARYLAASAAIDRLLDTSQFGEAVAAAERLLMQCRAVGEQAFPAAAYDLAMAYTYVGRTLKNGGAAGAALEPLSEAQKRFDTLAQAGNQGAAGMASVAASEMADCLRDLGRLDEAASIYQQSINWTEQNNDPRNTAVNKGNLGTVRKDQGRYADALAAYTEAKETFERLGEPQSVAVVWHQIGMVYKNAGDHRSAEHAYQESLKIRVQLGDRSGEASTLLELGNLYADMDRHEEAVRFYGEAAAIYVELGDLAREGVARSNAAIVLIQLHRYDEARRELLRAIKCKEPYGHAAEPWKTFIVLYDLERAVGNEQAAAEARQRAIDAYLAYRRAGGENHSTGGQLCAYVRQALAEGKIEEVKAQLAELLNEPDLPDNASALISALLQILAGNRDPALAADPRLTYYDAAELMLMT